MKLWSIWALVLCIASTVWAQNDKTIEVQNADVLEVLETEGVSVRKLVGNVSLTQGNVTMLCDSALLYYRENNARIFGNVYIKQGDSVEIKSRRAFYNGNQRKATFQQDVYLTDGKTKIYSDSLSYLVTNRKATLYNNVRLEDNRAKVKANKVEYIVKTKQAYLYDNVDLTANDGTKIRTDKMDYNANTKQVELYQNGQLKEKSGLEITSDRMSYNINSQEGSYANGGKLLNKETTLTSQKATYRGMDKKVLFEEDVHLQTPEYSLHTPQLDYDIATEKAKFLGSSTITNASGTIQANEGEYDAQNNSLTLNQRTTINQKEQQLTADNLVYDRKTGMTKATGNVIWRDSKQNLGINSQFLLVNNQEKTVLAYKDVLLTQLVDKDTLYITADTLQSTNRPPDKAKGEKDTIKNIFAYRNVKILKKDLQGVCGSLYYSTADSTFRMFQQPVLWSESYQLYADTIWLFTERNKPKQIHLLSNAFMGNELQKGVYNQIKGQNVLGYFVNQKIHHVTATGNAESVYFVQDEKKAYTGVNKSAAGIINMSFTSDGKADRVSYIAQPNAVFYPMSQVRVKDFILKGFEWKNQRRPLVLADIL
ncbi:MAG: LPS export ABC transporter periplasmic protein LptC [Chitinophagales bacterium]|nr:LPS export ABC transporter periplasmic protein LptC [Chitinophagales bacterium]